MDDKPGSEPSKADAPPATTRKAKTREAGSAPKASDREPPEKRTRPKSAEDRGPRDARPARSPHGSSISKTKQN